LSRSHLIKRAGGGEVFPIRLDAGRSKASQAFS